MSLADIAELLRLPLALPAVPLAGYGVDSRLLTPGTLFFALKGEKADGHDYLNQAKRQGAVAAVVSRAYRGSACGLHLLPVPDPLEALQGLARSVLANSAARVVAVTGSVGKTSTKEFLRTLLSKKYRVAASPGNYNSRIGVPLALLQHTKGDEELLVLEMGMTAPGHLKTLVGIAPPEVALITTVALVHAGSFGSLEEIARAKGEILTHPETQLGIIPRDTPHFHTLSQMGACRKCSFSIEDEQADYLLEGSNASYAVRSRLDSSNADLGPLHLPGRHNRHNLLAAVAAAKYFDVGWELLREALPLLALPEKRLQFISRHGVLFLNDAYNASEISVKAALELLPDPEGGGRKIAVLGSMLELGKFSEESHERVGAFALSRVEELYCLGEECEPLFRVWEKAGRPAQWFEERRELVVHLRKELRPGDVVLLKGSCSKELWKVLEEL